MTNVKNFLENIRKSIFAENENYQRLELPTPPKVWQDDNIANIANAKQSEDELLLLETFCQNLEKLNGESVLCDNFDNLILQIAKILRESKSDEIKIMISSHLLVRRVAENLQAVLDQLSESSDAKTHLTFYSEPPEDDLNLVELSSCDFGFVSAEALLADTGSGVFRANSRFERLAIYLPPVSIVVVGRSKLERNLPEAWKYLNTEIKNQNSGEFVIVTGPSRTADIEKILILGVHGPKRVLFMIYKDANE
ncbi:MAG: lactate utilization protein [Planctomycetaceae bacterium]|nr:lactate utilization protein [Planctomycetaceae bacterium]